jgi:hypothetical protein
VTDDGEGLALRPTRIGGERLQDDYQVIWQDMPIGRIMRRSGAPAGQPPWWFGVNVEGRPQPPGDRGVAKDLREAQRLFKAVWKRVHSELAYSDLQKARAHYGLQPHGRK